MQPTQLSASGLSQRLPELLFTEVLRIFLTESGDRELTGWLAALRDPSTCCSDGHRSAT
jgi:hypothetical protein